MCLLDTKRVVHDVLNSNSLAMMLTLRYDPTTRPIRKLLTPYDFHPKYGEWNIESDIIALIEEELSKLQRMYNFRHISLSLSGGIDSRLTLAMIRKFLPEAKMTCIGVGFGEEADEVHSASEIARYYDCDFHELILDNVLNELPKLISIVRQPRWNLYHYYAFEYGRRISEHFFTGDGGDELFGGYTFRYHKFLSQCPSDAQWEDKARLYLSCHERDWVPDQDEMFGKAIDFSWKRVHAHFKQYFQNTLDPIDQIFLADFNGKLLFDWLPTNQSFENHLGMHIHSLFLNDPMINFAFGVPWNKKYDPGRQVGKLPLRALLNKLGATTNANDFSKKGFSVGLDYLWNKNARDIVLKYLNAESEIIKNDLINGNWLTRTVSTLTAKGADLNPRYINKLLSLLALEIWHRLFLSDNMRGSEKL